MGSGRCEEVDAWDICMVSVKKTETQADMVKQAVCDLECDPNEAKWEDKPE